ncbi:MAG TPA: DHA2 family efflux MFS transporter permease subunit [Thermomicrobiales bacterium]|nr:DHA2 family efflux MFS transporter permease subunit [Thermomicrobiales bacterium]
MRNTTRYAIALVAALGLFPVALDATIVNVAIVPIAQALHASLDTIQWIFLGFLLANAAVFPLSGYLGTRLGTKRLFLIGLALFTFCSLLCGLAPTERWLVALRVLQGAGGGLLLPLGMAIALQPFAKEERAKATAVVGVPLLLAPVIGPIVGGAIIDGLNWQAIFFVNVPVGLVALLLAWWVLPADAPAAPQTPAGFDYLGLGLAMAGSAVLVYAFKLVSQTDPATRTAANPAGAIYGWGYRPVWALIALSLALLAAFAYRALRAGQDPVLDLRLFARRDFTVSNLAIWLNATISFGVLFLVPVYLQSVRLPHLSPVETGVALLPMGLATIVGVILGGALYRAVGPRLLVLAGTAFLALGCWRFGVLTPTTGIRALALPLALVGLSTTLNMVPTQTLALEALRDDALNKASSLVNATKLLWASVGSAALVTVYIQHTTAHAARLAAALPAAVLAQPTAPAALAARAQVATQAATSGMVDVFTLLLWSTFALVAVALFLPGHRAAAAGDTGEAPEQEPAPRATANVR